MVRAGAPYYSVSTATSHGLIILELDVWPVVVNTEYGVRSRWGCDMDSATTYRRAYLIRSGEQFLLQAWVVGQTRNSNTKAGQSRNDDSSRGDGQ